MSASAPLRLTARINPILSLNRRTSVQLSSLLHTQQQHQRRRCLFTRPQRTLTSRLPPTRQTPRLPIPTTQIRRNSSTDIPPSEKQAANAAKIYTFADIQHLSAHPSPDRIIIDVREPHELATTGRIPTAHGPVPFNTQPDGIALPPEDFEAAFGFAKPDKKRQEVVFYCRAGVRSTGAAARAVEAGYERVGNYTGSWGDWVKNGGPVEGGEGGEGKST